MKKHWTTACLPFFTPAVSLVGLLLSNHYYTSASGTGELLNHRHPAIIILLILSALVLIGLFLATRKIPSAGTLEQLLPANPVRGAANFVGAVGIAISCIQIATATDFLTIVSLVLGILGGVCMLFVGSQRMFRMVPHYLFYAMLTVFFMVMGLVRCRQWGTETQILWFFFSLLAQVFILLATFQYTAVCATGSSPRALILYSHAAIFFCCLAFPARYDLFYLTSALWLALDSCVFQIPEKE